MDIIEEVNASKETISGDDVWNLLKEAPTIFVASGKKILQYVPGDDVKEELMKKACGRTGNLRAPTLKIGDNYYIGFNEPMYEQIGSL